MRYNGCFTHYSNLGESRPFDTILFDGRSSKFYQAKLFLLIIQYENHISPSTSLPSMSSEHIADSLSETF